MYVYLYRTLYYFYSPVYGVGASTSASDARGPGSIPLMGIILIFSKACSTNKFYKGEGSLLSNGFSNWRGTWEDYR